MPLISGGGGSFTLPALAAAAASDTNHGGLVITQGAAAAGDEILRVDDSEGNTVFSVTPDGRCILFSNGARQEASLILSDNTPGNAGQLAFDTFSGVNLSPEAGSAGILQFFPRAGHTGDTVLVRSPAGLNTFRVSADNKIGLFDHAPAAQQTLHSATATPEQIALALEANGFCGGD